MADCEEIGSFKKNLKILASAVANDKLSLKSEMEKVWSWVNWTDEGPQHHPGCTAAHQDYMRIQAAADIATGLLRRKYVDPVTEVPLAMKYFRWCLDIAAVNIAKRLDTDRLFFLVATPDFSFYSTNDRVPPYRQVLELMAKADQGEASEKTGMVVEDSVMQAQAVAEAAVDTIFDASFVSQLRPDDFCDFLREDGMWVYAKILELSPTDTEIHVEDINGGEREWLSVEDAHRFAPMGSKVGTSNSTTAATATATAPPPSLPEEEMKWRMENFHPGFLVDARDKANKWYQAVITDKRSVSNGPNNNNNTTTPPLSVEEVRVSFLGWASKNDEWLPVSSARLDRLNYQSVGRRGTTTAVTFETDQERQPPDSHITDTDPQHVAVVQRPVSNMVFQKGPLYAELLNHFWMSGAEDGESTLSRLMSRLAESSTALSEHFVWLAGMSQTLAYAADMYTNAYVSQLVKPWLEFVDYFVSKMSEDDVRCVTKDLVDSLVLSIKRLARRVSPDGTIAGMRAEKLQLEIALRCIRSAQIMRRLDGLKLFSEARSLALHTALHPSGVSFSAQLHEYIRWPTASWFNLPDLAAWIIDNNIIHDIFVARHHRQLVRLSGDLVRVLHSDLVRCNLDKVGKLQDGMVDDIIASLGLGGEDTDATVFLLCEIATELPATALRRLLHHVLGAPQDGGVDALADSHALAAQDSGYPLSTIKLLTAMALSNPRCPIAVTEVASDEQAEVVIASIAALGALALGVPPALAGSVSPHRARVDANVSEASMKSLLSCLQHSSIAPLRTVYMQLALGLISAQIYPVRAMALLRGIIDTYPTARPSKPIAIPTLLLSPDFIAAATSGAVPTATAVSSATSPTQVRVEDLADSELCMADVILLLHRKFNLTQVMLGFLQTVNRVASNAAWLAGLVPLYCITRLNVEGSADAAIEGILKEIDSRDEPSTVRLDSVESALKAAAKWAPSDLPSKIARIDEMELRTTVQLPQLGDLCGNPALVEGVVLALQRFVVDRTEVSLGAFSQTVKATFSLLGYLLQHSSLCLRLDETLQLWDACIGHCLSYTHRGLCLAWFTFGVSALSRQSASGKENSSYLTPEVADAIFAQRLNSEQSIAEAPFVDNIWFTAWKIFFIFCNAKYGNMDYRGTFADKVGVAGSPSAAKEGQAIETSFTVTSLDLVGIDSLWELTLRARDISVATSAVSLLTSLQQRLSPELMPRKKEFRARYINRCMKFIGSAVSVQLPDSKLWGESGPAAPVESPMKSPALTRSKSAYDSVDSNQLIQRCVALLDSMLDEAEEETYIALSNIRKLLVVAHAAVHEGDYSGSFSDNADLLVEARRMLAHSAHSSYAAELAEPFSQQGGQDRSDSWITLRLNINVKIFDSGSAPEQATTPVASSSEPTEPVDNDADNTGPEVSMDVFIGPRLPTEEEKKSQELEKLDDSATSQLPVKRIIKADEVKIALNCHEPLNALRLLIEDLVGAPCSNFRILLPAASVRGGDSSKPREIKGALLSRTAAQLGIKDGATIPVISLVPVKSSGSSTPHAAKPKESPEESEPYVELAQLSNVPQLSEQLVTAMSTAEGLPAWILARQAGHMNVLLALLDSPTGLEPTTCAKVWRLLCRLPSHVSYISSLYRLSTEPLWTDALPSAPARLAYGILALRSILARNTSAQAKGISLEPSTRLSHLHSFALSRVVGGKDASLLVDALQSRSVELQNQWARAVSPLPLRAEPWHDDGVQAQVDTWTRKSFEAGGLRLVFQHLSHILLANGESLFTGKLSPLQLSCIGLSMECVYVYFSAALHFRNASLQQLPFHSIGCSFGQPSVDESFAEATVAQVEPHALYDVCLQVFTLAFKSHGARGALAQYGESGPHHESLNTLIQGALTLWSQLICTDAALWHRTLEEKVFDLLINNVLVCNANLLGSSTRGLSMKTRCTVALCLHGISTIAGGKSSGGVRANSLILQCLIEALPKPNSLALGEVSVLSVYYVLLETILRTELAQAAAGSSTLSIDMVKLAMRLCADLKVHKNAETELGATAIWYTLLPALSKQETWSFTVSPSIIPGVDAFRDPISACTKYLSAVRNRLVADGGHMNEVAAMDPVFCGFAVPDGAASVLSPQSTMVPTVGTGVSPVPMAIADTAAGLGTLNNFVNSNIMLEEEVVLATAGVDQILAGTLRLLTALFDFDPQLAGDMGIPPAAATLTGGPHPLASSEATAIVAGGDLITFIYRHCLTNVASPTIVTAKDMGAQALYHDKPTGNHYPLLQRPVTGPERGAICKTFVSRRAAYKLLTTMLRCSSRNAAAFGQLLIESTRLWLDSKEDMLGAPVGWRQDPATRDSVSSTGYVGLRNLGCICYMNSLMQQFFMCEPLRYGVLSVPKYELHADKDKADSVLYQLQRMFGFLDMSTRKHYDPASWCVSFKDYDGRPTNVLIQQDAQEYLTTFLDRIEFAMKGTPQHKLVQRVLGIETKEARFCTGGCGTMRSSSEPGVSLSVSVTQGNMKASLDSYTAWEDIPDYSCDECKKRTTLRKRNTIGSLSNTLIVHLKRFEMNYDTGMPNKLNNRFEFPTELDLYPYSYECYLKEQAAALKKTEIVEEAEDGYYAYQLVGIVVHMGTLESGHYYSFIRERGPRAFAKAQAKAEASGQQLPEVEDPACFRGNWMEFNDSFVTPFDESKIPEQCFGGVTTTQTWNSALKQHVSTETPIVKNAYMLVYERKKALPLDVPASDLPHLRLAADTTARVLPKDLVPLDTVGRGPMPTSILRDVLHDNLQITRLCQVMEPEFSLCLHSYAEAISRHPAFFAPGKSCYPQFTELARDNELCEQMARNFERDMQAARQRNGKEGEMSVIAHYRKAFGESLRSIPSFVSKPDIFRALFLHCFVYLGHSAHVHLVPHFTYTLARMVSQSNLDMVRHVTAAALRSTVANGYDMVKETLIRSPIAMVRGSFSRLLLTALVRLLHGGDEARHLPPRYEKSVGLNKYACMPSVACESKELILSLLSSETVDFVAQSWKMMNSYHQLLCDIARLGFGTGIPLNCDGADPAVLHRYSVGDRDECSKAVLTASPDGAALRSLLVAGHRVRHGLILHKAIETTLDLFLGPRHSTFVLGSPTSASKKRPAIGSKTVSPNWVRAFDFVSVLVRSMYTSSNEDWAPMSPFSIILGPVPSNAHGIAWLDSHSQLERECPAPSIDDAEMLLRYASAAAEQQVEDEKALGPIPGLARDPVSLKPMPKSFFIPHSLLQQLPASSDVDSAIVRRSRERVLGLQRQYGGNLEKLLRSKTITISGKVISHSDDIPREPPCVVDTVEENAFNVTDNRAQRAAADKPEGFVLLDTLIEEKGNQLKMLYHENLWNVFLGVEDELLDQHFPDAFGPNLEAVSQIACHLVYGDRAFTARLQKFLIHAMESVHLERLRPLFAICEAVLMVPDIFKNSRFVKVFDNVNDWFLEACKSKSVETSMDYLHFMLRLLALHPVQAKHYLTKDDALLFAIESWLRTVEVDVKEGWGKSSAWMASMIDAEARPEATTGKSPTAGLSERDKEILPIKQCMLGYLVHVQSMSMLSARDEWSILTYLALNPSLRATLYLQRLKRIIAAHGLSLLGPARIQERQKELAGAAGAGETEASRALEDLAKDLD